MKLFGKIWSDNQNGHEEYRTYYYCPEKEHGESVAQEVYKIKVGLTL